jgi:hypothetical protein
MSAAPLERQNPRVSLRMSVTAAASAKGIWRSCPGTSRSTPTGRSRTAHVSRGAPKPNASRVCGHHEDRATREWRGPMSRACTPDGPRPGGQHPRRVTSAVVAQVKIAAWVHGAGSTALVILGLRARAALSAPESRDCEGRGGMAGLMRPAADAIWRRPRGRHRAHSRVGGSRLWRDCSDFYEPHGLAVEDRPRTAKRGAICSLSAPAWVGATVGYVIAGCALAPERARGGCAWPTTAAAIITKAIAHHSG